VGWCPPAFSWRDCKESLAQLQDLGLQCTLKADFTGKYY
jgi:hypothetical protein